MPPNKRQTNPSTWTARDVELDQILDNPAPVRAVDPVAVASLRESFELVGQQVPIVLSADNVLVSGRQRVAAQRARGESTIRAVFIDLPEVLTRIATLDENLCRAELTALERAQLLAERKALHEQTNPGSRHGSGRAGRASPGFTRSMAEATGRGRSTVAEDCKIGAMSESVRALIRGTRLERRKAALLDLARLPGEAEQLRVCRALLDGSAPNVKAALRQPAKEPSNVEPLSVPEPVDPVCEEVPDENRTAPSSAATLVESGLEPLQNWLDEAETSPEVENRFVESAIALSSYAVTLLNRVASGIEASGETSDYAKRVRRSARALAQRAQRMTDDLMLVAECSCSDGCSSCGFARGLAAIDLQADRSKSSGETGDPGSGSFEGHV